MPTGQTCGSPAMRHQSYCYFHNEQRKHEARKLRVVPSCSCPYFPRIPIDPKRYPECPAVVAARFGIVTAANCKAS